MCYNIVSVKSNSSWQNATPLLNWYQCTISSTTACHTRFTIAEQSASNLEWPASARDKRERCLLYYRTMHTLCNLSRLNMNVRTTFEKMLSILGGWRGGGRCIRKFVGKIKLWHTNHTHDGFCLQTNDLQIEHKWKWLHDWSKHRVTWPASERVPHSSPFSVVRFAPFPSPLAQPPRVFHQIGAPLQHTHARTFDWINWLHGGRATQHSTLFTNPWAPLCSLSYAWNVRWHPTMKKLSR